MGFIHETRAEQISVQIVCKTVAMQIAAFNSIGFMNVLHRDLFCLCFMTEAQRISHCTLKCTYFCSCTEIYTFFLPFQVPNIVQSLPIIHIQDLEFGT